MSTLYAISESKPLKTGVEKIVERSWCQNRRAFFSALPMSPLKNALTGGQEHQSSSLPSRRSQVRPRGNYGPCLPFLITHLTVDQRTLHYHSMEGVCRQWGRESSRWVVLIGRVMLLVTNFVLRVQSPGSLYSVVELASWHIESSY